MTSTLDSARSSRAFPSFPRVREGSMGWGLRVVLTLVGLLLVAPTAVVIPMSFSSGLSFEFPPKHWSLRWYQEFFHSQAWTAALLNSLQIALIVAVLATLMGVGAAYVFDRVRFSGRGAARSLIMAPMITPGIVVAVAVYATFLRWHLNGTLLGFVIAHTVLALPFVITSVSTALAGYDRRLEAAAASLGATPLSAFLRVTIPLVAPGVASGFVFAFVTSLDEVVVALFLQTPDIRTLPVQMYESVTLEVDPTIAAASSMIVVFTTAVLLLPQFLRQKRSAP
ncbi:ABC transporter permease [Streptomyces acidicola]|uniref:ABC transporter permease n=1 Tax=Streptomyces acidicola TaxID=2596892 RepID=UPI0034462CFA